MLSQIYWHTPNRVLVFKMTGIVNLDDTHALKRAVDAVLSDPDAHVHFIIDARDKDSLDPQLFKLRDTVKILTDTSNWHGKLGWMLVVDDRPNIVMDFVSSVAAQLIKADFRHFKTMDDALKLLHHVDAQIALTLPAEPENLLTELMPIG